MQSPRFPLLPKPSSPQTTQPQTVAGAMNFACQPCVRKKIKCDKATPLCSSCNKAKLECFYQPPQPRSKKRKHSQTISERLERYEAALQENGLLPESGGVSPSTNTPQEHRRHLKSPLTDDHEGLQNGKMLSSRGKARYVNGMVWQFLGEEDINAESDTESNDRHDSVDNKLSVNDPLSEGLFASPSGVEMCQPSPMYVTKLWSIYVENVNPLCKIVHEPTTAKIVEESSKSCSTVSKSHQCLLFAIYHFAVTSMTEEDCCSEFGQSRAALAAAYQSALWQSLARASWLKTTELPVIQAYVLYLLAIRGNTDPHTFWILTGIAVRLAQRIGLHRDGARLGLMPFDVEMRRRLFWQLLPLDGFAGQASGTGISIPPNSWDTKQPLNVNDDQIHPDMTTLPMEQKAATEMIFCLARSELTKVYCRSGVKFVEVGATVQLKDCAQLESIIDQAESTIEAKYLRHCDIIDPLHLLTSGIVRSAGNGARIHNELPQLLDQTISDQKRKELCVLSGKVLDTYNTILTDARLRRFRWSMKNFSVWDSFTCLLNSLCKPGFFTPSEVEGIWKKIADVYANQPEIFDGKGALRIALGKTVVKAWKTNPSPGGGPVPAFISLLYSQHRLKAKKSLKSADNPSTVESTSGPDSTTTISAAFDDNLVFEDLNIDSLLNNNFNFDLADWESWE